MMISAKSRYALRVMVDLAQRNTGEFIPVKEIAARQGISLKYLESIMTILTKGKMLESASGKGGGYRLVRAGCKTGGIVHGSPARTCDGNTYDNS